MNKDRRDLNDQEKAECAALKAEIGLHNARVGTGRRITQEYLAQELGMTQGNLSSHLNGKRPISKEMAAKIARLLGIKVEAFSPRLAAEIAEMALAVSPVSAQVSANEISGAYLEHSINDLIDLATPRSKSVLARINQAAREGRLSEADIDLLDQIAARFVSSGEQPAAGEGSHKRLRDKLQKNDPHPKQ